VCARVAVQRPSIAHSLRQPAEPSPAPHHVFSLSPPPQISECRNRNYFCAPSHKRNLILAKSLFCSSARLRQIAFLALCFDLSIPCFFFYPARKVHLYFNRRPSAVVARWTIDLHARIHTYRFGRSSKMRSDNDSRLMPERLNHMHIRSKY